MKANFVCFKISKTIIILSLVILIELLFIFIGINEKKEENSFEDIKEKITKNQITQYSIINKDLVRYSNTINDIENNASKEETKALEEYKNMPRELKGYKVIRKNSNSKAKIRYLYFRRNK